MKTGLWAVFLWADTKAVGGASLDREFFGTAKTLIEGGLLRPVLGVSLHSSAAAADKAARVVAERLKPSGWWLAEDSAKCEERQLDSLTEYELRNREDQHRES